MTIAALANTSAGAAWLQIDLGNGFFFNKPGGAFEQLFRDIAQCRATAEGADSQINGAGVLVGGVGSLCYPRAG